MFIALVVWFISLFGIMVLLLLTRSATVFLNNAIDERNYFRSLLSTTENYVAMVDDSSRIIYISNIMMQLANVEDARLVKGRYLIDLFPARELKLLVGKLFMHKRKYVGDWEFILNGKKRFFKAYSVGLPGTSGTLINLHDFTYLAERDEIAVMKDSLKIGLFFMDSHYVIQDHYSRFLEEILELKDITGKHFTDLLSNSLNARNLDSVKDYFEMIFNRTYDQTTLDDINPLNEFQYVCLETGDKKVFHCEFATVERDRGEVFVLVTIYDVTAKTELQQQLLEEENRRQEEMQSIFELIKVDRDVFGDFLNDAEYEFSRIDETLKNNALSTQEVLVDIYQSVHAIKSDAVTLGLNTFGNKVHKLESKIKALRDGEKETSFNDMLNLAIEVEKLHQEKDGFKVTIEKIQSFSNGPAPGKSKVSILLESLSKATAKVAADLDKKVQFVVDGIDSEAIEKGPRRVMKEVLMQLVRNSVVHGVETPEERLANGKNETGTIRLSIKISDENIHIKLGDDGRGLDYKKIREKAERLNLIRKEDGEDKNLLIKAIFSPGFSTADDEGIHAGRGIGLNLVRDRVRDVKGAIKLQSESGKGTVFNLIIPVTDTALGM
jgi:two-component system chemotaxis sensor kinase CheA